MAAMVGALVIVAVVVAVVVVVVVVVVIAVVVVVVVVAAAAAAASAVCYLILGVGHNFIRFIYFLHVAGNFEQTLASLTCQAELGIDSTADEGPRRLLVGQWRQMGMGEVA